MDMDILFLSRLQFAITTIYHFFFVPLSIGLSLFLAIWETVSYRSGNSDYEKISRFWNRLFLLCFIIGVVTGIVQEFQFGMNWSEYSRFVGDVFGAPLAMETLLSFFLQSTFIGLWIFGRTLLPREVHLSCIWLVFGAACLSAVWLLIANSFMQHPVGYAFNNGRAEMTDFFALITNPYFLHQFPHVIAASICTSAFFVLGISAWKIYKEAKDSHLFEKTFKFALFMGLLGLIALAVTGYFQAQSISKLQPIKFAALENLEKTENSAALSIVPGVKVPAMLSFIAHGKFSGEVKGLEDLQKQMERRYGPSDFRPPVWISYISFRLMILLSIVMFGFVLYGIIWYMILKKNMHRKALLAMVFGIALPFIANTAGWLISETGRQPWIVYGLMPTEKAISVGVSRGDVIFSIAAFTIIYGILSGVAIFLMRVEIKRSHIERKITKKTPAVTV
jgi:cytochrome d ubiquinol oxidase subunit I